MISVNEALDALFALVAPLPSETVPLTDASGRILAKDARAIRDQPPFAASIMDGYAVPVAEVATGDTFTVIGEAAAGHAFDGTLSAGQAVRIFTGAPLPDGAKRVVIQEDVCHDANTITIGAEIDSALYIRPSGADFKAGDALTAPRHLTPSDLALLAAMNHPTVEVTRKPVVAIIATGDELVQPGETPGPDQIIASNSYGLKALLEKNGAEVRLLPIARDNLASLELAFSLADGADLVVTIGGASVGDHDLVAAAAASRGMERSFYKIAMRPGKPLMAGRLGSATMIGLPGNPVSAMVCGHVFVLPVLRKMLRLGAAPAERQTAPLAHDIPANGPREHYMRAKLEGGKVTIFERQDSALLTVLADANCLCVRPPHAASATKGETVEIILL